MKHPLLIPSILILLAIFIATSCKDATLIEPGMEVIPIKDSLGIVPFSFKAEPDSVQKSLFWSS
jgi:hypothetical protein